MRPVIKAESGDLLVRAFPSPAIGVAPEGPLVRLEAELAAARREIADLRSALEAAKAESAATAQRAQERGRAEGAAAAGTREGERLAAVERGIADARHAWDARLETLEGLAAMLARAGLAKIFAPHADLADLTARAIARQAGALGGETTVAIRVSPADFDTPALACLREAGVGPITADPALASGACRFDLLLGSRDVGPADQWAVLDRFLSGLVA